MDKLVPAAEQKCEACLSTPAEAEKLKEEQKNIRRDQIFRKVFGHPSLLLMFLQDYVKQDWVKDLKLEDLERLPREFPSIYSKDRESDVVVKVRLRDLEVYLIVLVEHQTAVHHFMAFRILEYMVLIWRFWLENIPENKHKQKDFKLPAILPIVFYDAPGKWTAETSFLEKVDHVERFGKHVPNFEYKVVELGGISLEDLDKCGNALSLIFLFDKCNSEVDLEKAQQMRRAYWEMVKESLADSGTLEVVADCVQALLERAEANPETVQQVIDDLRQGRLPEMFEHTLSDVRIIKEHWAKNKDALLAEERRGGARDEKISLLSRLFAKKFKASSSIIEELIGLQTNEVLDNLGESIFSIESIEELKGFLKKQ